MAQSDGSLLFDTKIDTKDFESGINKIKSTATKGFAAVGASAAAGIGTAIKLGSDFEEAMSSVSAISMATADEYEMLSSAARKMGEETKYSATQAANALEYLSLAGYSAEESVEALPKVLNLAAAGGMDLAYASDLLTDSMAVMGLGIQDMDNFSDQLAMAASKSNTSVQQLGEAVLIAGGQAKLAGMDTVQMNTALGILADNGIKGAEGGTALRNALKNLYTPTSSAAKAMNALGVKTSDAQGNLRSAQDVLQDLNKGLSKLSEADKIDVMGQIFDTRTIAAGSALLKNAGERWNELSGYLKDCDGAAAQMAETMNDNLKGKLTLLGSAAEGLAIAFYDGIQEPLKNAVDEGASKISELTRSLSGGDLSGALANIGNLLGGLANGAITLAKTALPPLVKTLGFIGNSMGLTAPLVLTVAAAYKSYNIAVIAANAAQALFNTTLTFSPFGLVAAGIAALGVAVAGITIAVQNSQTEWNNFGDSIEETAQSFESAKNKAELTGDHAAQWRELKDAIASGQIPADQLAEAEGKVKEHEQWFIDNYGNYISAEEQKNGIRQETIDLLEEEAGKLSAIAKAELESEMLDNRSEIQEHIDKVKVLENENKTLEKTVLQNRTLSNTLRELVSDYDLTASSGGDTAAAMEDLLKKASDLTGLDFSNVGAIRNHILELSDSADKAKGKIDENTQAIQDNEESLGQYASGVQKLMELDLGADLDTWRNSFDLLKQAQQEFSEKGKLSEETLNKLKDKFPELKEQDVSIDTINTKLGEMEQQEANALSTLDKYIGTLKNTPKQFDFVINFKTNVTGDKVPGHATGVKNAPRGLAVVNEKGRELIKSKDGSFRYVDSGTSALTYLNQGDTVYTAAQSKRMLNSANVKIPGFAGGLNNYSGSTAMSSISIDLRFGDVAGGLEDALLSGQGKIKKAGEKLGENAIDGFNDSFDGETEKSGQDFVDGFTDGINGSQSEAVSVSGDMASDSTNQLSSAASEAMGIGSQLASNFAAGISSGESAVASAAGGLASTAIAALSAAAGQALGIGLTSAGTLDIQIVDSKYKLSADAEKMKKEMDLGYSLGAMSLEDYTKNVTYWRDNHVKKYTQQWWDATKTIVSNNQTVANEAKKTAENNAKAAQQAAEKAQKAAEDRRKKQIEEELNALQHQHDMELISDEQYINGKEAIYNKYYKGDKDKAREIEKARRDLEEKNYLDQREKSFNNIEFWRKMGYITESQYWEEYKRLTEMYYDPNRDRDREEYRSKISAYYDHEIEERDKARQKEQDRIEWLYSKGLISAKEYYDSMTRYRDRWFEKGTDEWEDFNKTVIENLDFSSVISEKLDAVLDKQKSMRDKLYDSVSLYQTYEPGLKIGGEAVKLNVATNWGFEKQKLQNYFDTFDDLKNRVDMPTELLDDIRNMSRDEGMQFMQVLQNMDDDELKKYIEDYKSYFDLANKGSEDMYADDAVQTAKDTAEEIAQQLKDAGFEVPDTFFELGKTSVKRFGEGFEEQLKTIKEKMNSSVASALVKYLPSFVADGKPTSGDVTVVTNNNYNITAKDESAKGQMDAIYREQDYRDMK